MENVEQSPNEAQVVLPSLPAQESVPPTAPEPSLEDYAANNYRELLPSFRTQIDHLSGNQAKKVLVALMEYPLEKTDFQWSYPEARRAFVTGANIMDCRFVLMKALLELTMEQKRAILDETKDDKVPPSPTKQGEEE